MRELRREKDAVFVVSFNSIHLKSGGDLCLSSLCVFISVNDLVGLILTLIKQPSFHLLVFLARLVQLDLEQVHDCESALNATLSGEKRRKYFGPF